MMFTNSSTCQFFPVPNITVNSFPCNLPRIAEGSDSRKTLFKNFTILDTSVGFPQNGTTLSIALPNFSLAFVLYVQFVARMSFVD